MDRLLRQGGRRVVTEGGATHGGMLVGDRFLLEPGEDLAEPEGVAQAGGQLDAERKAVDEAADGCDGGLVIEREIAGDATSPGPEQVDGGAVGRVEGLEVLDRLPIDAERLPAGHDHVAIGGAREDQVDDVDGGIDDVLGVVEDEEPTSGRAARFTDVPK